MIRTTYAGEFGTRLGWFDSGDMEKGPMFGETVAEMPELRAWMAKELSEDRHERGVAQRVGSLPMWRALDWEPEAAEKVLGWIRTGEWSPAVLPDGSRASGLVIVGESA